MLEVYGNLWDYPADLRVITTNGFVKKDGSCVMGRGCAKQAAEKWLELPRLLGMAITKAGNKVHVFHWLQLATFPVKPISEKCHSDKANVVKHMQSKFVTGSMVPGWACIANHEIIKTSAIQLANFVNKHPEYKTIVCPRFGCGAGELDWSVVKNIVAPILDDRFHIITF
jgi:hypothetical protein